MATWSQLLRMRPDRIVVGEVRDAAALDMLQAMNTGHDGSISTIHSNSPRDSLSRLETITMMAGMELSPRSIREQISSAIQLIVHQQRLKDGSRRFTHVTEIEGMEGETTLRPLSSTSRPGWTTKASSAAPEVNRFGRSSSTS